jgi:hypothetical protein
MMLFGTAVVAVLFLLALGVPSASADTLDYTLTVGNSAISSFGPYGTVDVNRTSNTTATITFTALTGFRLGDSGPGGNAGFGVNVNASSWSVSSVLPSSYTNGGPAMLDGTGNYNQTFYDNGGFGAAVTTFSFDISAASANWLNASQVLVANSNGPLGNFAVGAHVFVCDNAGCTSATNTGYAGGVVPDGGVTLMLLGGVLVSVETIRRKLHV